MKVSRLIKNKSDVVLKHERRKYQQRLSALRKIHTDVFGYSIVQKPARISNKTTAK